MSEWKPIAEAPKEGCVLVTFSPEDLEGLDPRSMPGVMVAQWDAYYAEGGSGYSGGDGWCDVHSGEECRLHYGFPTKFMPIPAR